ncbi:MAG TPA: type II toxin-antitoxin system RelE/ParE family toxin [Thiobacillaceae bacterium]|nr:type II toxin-antitoxin system RelE/ParE family toxin [Thiobacillaceae bacterium]
MRISVSAKAPAEVEEAGEWYIGVGAPQAASDFIDALEYAFGLLRQFPNMGARGPLNTRVMPLHAFPYSLIYRIQQDTVRVIAVANQSRRPGYWAGRR